MAFFIGGIIVIAMIDGITVMGTPEEIQRFREITAKKVTTTNITFTMPDIPKIDFNKISKQISESLNNISKLTVK